MYNDQNCNDRDSDFDDDNDDDDNPLHGFLCREKDQELGPQQSREVPFRSTSNSYLNQIYQHSDISGICTVLVVTFPYSSTMMSH